jgi:nucleoid DNA-binding protein
MNKSDLIKVIAEVPGLSKQQAELALKAFCDAITSALNLKRKMGVFVELALSEVFDFGFVWW